MSEEVNPPDVILDLVKVSARKLHKQKRVPRIAVSEADILLRMQYELEKIISDYKKGTRNMFINICCFLGKCTEILGERYAQVNAEDF